MKIFLLPINSEILNITANNHQRNIKYNSQSSEKCCLRLEAIAKLKLLIQLPDEHMSKVRKNYKS